MRPPQNPFAPPIGETACAVANENCPREGGIGGTGGCPPAASDDAN